MQTDTGFTCQAAMGEICKDIVAAVADRPGDSAAHRLVRQQTAALSVLSLQPRDPLEMMLAGQCLIFDHLLRDGLRDVLHGEPEPNRLRARPGLFAAGRLFLANLRELEKMRERPEETLPFRLPSPDAPSDTATADTAAAPASPLPPKPTNPAHSPDPGLECPPLVPIASVSRGTDQPGHVAVAPASAAADRTAAAPTGDPAPLAPIAPASEGTRVAEQTPLDRPSTSARRNLSRDMPARLAPSPDDAAWRPSAPVPVPGVSRQSVVAERSARTIEDLERALVSGRRPDNDPRAAVLPGLPGSPLMMAPLAAPAGGGPVNQRRV